MERVIRKQIQDYLSENNLIEEDQHGSRAGRSTLTQLLDFHDNIVKNLEENTNIDIIYLDYTKTYDKSTIIF